MKKYDDNLFKIGEIAKILGVTRKTILVYEDMGLLTPAIKDEKSGYRYYTADKYDTDPLHPVLAVFRSLADRDFGILLRYRESGSPSQATDESACSIRPQHSDASSALHQTGRF